MSVLVEYHIDKSRPERLVLDSLGMEMGMQLRKKLNMYFAGTMRRFKVMPDNYKLNGDSNDTE